MSSLDAAWPPGRERPRDRSPAQIYFGLRQSGAFHSPSNRRDGVRNSSALWWPSRATWRSAPAARPCSEVSPGRTQQARDACFGVSKPSHDGMMHSPHQNFGLSPQRSDFQRSYDHGQGPYGSPGQIGPSAMLGPADMLGSSGMLNGGSGMLGVSGGGSMLGSAGLGAGFGGVMGGSGPSHGCSGGGGGMLGQYGSPSRLQGHYHSPSGSGTGLRMSNYQVYDMKSLSYALATVQAGTGEVRKIFAASTFRPRLPGLTKLVSQLTREGHWQKGLEVFETLDVLGVRPDTTITNAAISACDKGGQWEKALQVFHNMEEWGLQRDAITYSAVISALSKGRQWSLSIDVFNHMCANGIECDAVTCCSLITALDKGGQWQLAEQVFTQMYADHPQFKVLLQCMSEDVGMPSICTGPPGASSSGTGSSTSLGGKSPSAESLAAMGLTRQLSASKLNLLNSYMGGEDSSGGSGDASGGAASGGASSAVSLLPGGGGAGGWTAGVASATSGRLYRTVSAFPPPGVPSIDENLPAGTPGFWNSKNDMMSVWDRGPTTPRDSISGSQARWSPLTPPPFTPDGGGMSPEETAFLLRSPQGSSGSLLVAQSALLGSPTNTFNVFPGGMADLHSTFGDPRSQLLGMSMSSASDMMGSPYTLHRSCSMPSAPSSPSGPLSRTSGTAGTSLMRSSSLNTKKSAPNRVCCNALLAAYARAVPTQWHKAVRLLELMWTCGGELCPDIVSYNTVIKACGNAQQIELGFKVYHLMRKRGIEPTVATYGTLITIASDAQQSGRVKEAWGWLQASGLEVHVTCVNAYLAALIKEGDWEDAQNLFQHLMRPGAPAKPNALTFNLMMAAHLARNEGERVAGLFEDMYTVGVAPSVNTYSTLVNAYAQKGQWDESTNVLAFMCRPDSAARPAIGTFTSLFSSLHTAAIAADESGEPAMRALMARRLHAVRTLLKSQGGLHPDMATYRTMISAFQRVGECDVVVELFNVLMGQNMSIDAETAAAVLEAVCAQKSWDKVVQLMKVLQEQGPKLPMETVKAILLTIAKDEAWVPAYCVLKVCSGSGLMDDLIQALKGEGYTDLLFLALLVGKENSGAWVEALQMFKWMQQVQKTPLSCSREVYRIMFELLVIHGGVEGLRHAVMLCRQAHETGLLNSYMSIGGPSRAPNASPTPPATPGSAAAIAAATAAAAAPGLGMSQVAADSLVASPPSPHPALASPPSTPSSTNGKTGNAAGALHPAALKLLAGSHQMSSYVVALEGFSRIETIVTLMSWLMVLKDSASVGTRLEVPFVDIAMGAGHVDSLDSQHVRPAVCMVLEGRCAEFLGVVAEADLTPEQRAVVMCFVGPAAFYADLTNAAVVHVNTQSLYTAMGI